MFMVYYYKTAIFHLKEYILEMYISSLALTISAKRGKPWNVASHKTNFLMFWYMIPTFSCYRPVCGRLSFAFLHVLPFTRRALSFVHACSEADVMPCDKLRPRWAPRAPLPTKQAPPYFPPHPLPSHITGQKNQFGISGMVGPGHSL